MSSTEAWPCTVVARSRGHVRMRAPRWTPDEAALMLSRLRAHPAVRDADHNERLETLTVNWDASQTLEHVLTTLPDAASITATPTPPPPGPLWRQMALPAVSIAAGLTGVIPLAGPVIGVCALPIARRAVRSLKSRNVTIDVLDAAAVSLLIGTGDVLAAGVSVGLIEIGERIRRRASGGARRVLRSWMGADSNMVRVVRDGSEPRVDIAEVAPGDQVVIYAGETIPIDGRVVAGTATVDNKTWTGEPTPLDVEQGASVLAGSTVVDGRIVVHVEAMGEETRAGRLAAALEDAIAADTRISDMARRMSNRFVLPVMGLGFAVFVGTGDLTRLISILIVDFGTGIRIAVPTSILTTMISGARSSILFRNGNAIEQLATIDTIVFDKTGTLTSGHPTVLGMSAVDGWTEAEVFRLAAAAEGHLPHPIARAVRRHARRLDLELPAPTQVHYEQGGGVEATVEGRDVLVGDVRLLRARGIDFPATEETDSSVVMVAVDGDYVAQMRLRDRIKPDAADAIATLRREGIREIWLATGDRPNAARTVARQLQLDGFRAKMMPEDKVTLVRELRAAGRRVAVVGDGINDAAAMAEADIGISVPRGAELAKETADIVLGHDDLMIIATAIGLSRRAMSLVHQNIGLVAAPNAVALALAATGTLPPLAATAVNNGSTLIAALNALRPLRDPVAPRQTVV